MDHLQNITYFLETCDVDVYHNKCNLYIFILFKYKLCNEKGNLNTNYAVKYDVKIFFRTHIPV